MKYEWLSKLSWAIVLVVLLAACGQSSPSGVAPPARGGGVPDLAERGLMTPTGWFWLTGVSIDAVKAKIEDGYRVFDLEVDSTSPFRVSVAMVKNEGEYKKGWWWYYGQTGEQVKNLISSKKARIIDFEVYHVNNQQRFAVVMVPNSGAQAKGWWWYYGLSFAQVGEKISEKKGRLLDLDSYVVNGQRRFNIVMIPNSGTDQKAWWYYVNIDAATLKAKLSDNKARITDLEVHSNGRFNVIMEKTSGETWWYYYGQTMAQVNDKTKEKGARIIDIERYKNSSNQTRFAVVMLKNGKPQEPEPEPDNGTTDELTERSLTTPTGWWWLTGVPADQIKNKIRDGYRIIDLEVEQTSPYRFSAAFVKNEGEHKKGWWWYYGQTGEQVKNLISEKKARIIDLQIYRVNGQKRYAVVMVSNTGKDAKAWWYYSDQTIQSLADKVKENDARLVDLDTYVVGGRRLYSGVMLKNKGGDAKAWWYYYNVSADFIANKLKEHKARLVDIERHGPNTFTVIMEKNPGKAWWWYYGVSMDQVNDLSKRYGTRIIDVEPYTVDGKKRFNVTLLDNGFQKTGSSPRGLGAFDTRVIGLMRQYGIPGGSLAVTKDDRLVLARGYGYADMEASVAAKPEHLFRIASISKRLTETAIQNLDDEGAFGAQGLDTPFMDLLSVEPPEGESVKDERIYDVTVRHLLEHQGGWDREASFDPMFRPGTVAAEVGVSAPAGCTSVIRYMLTEDLDFTPGSQTVYSNFGYCILGRVIEAVSGQTYNSYVQQEVLSPAGISEMRLGKTKLSDRATGEVRYYDYPFAPLATSVFPGETDKVPWPYGGFYLEAMDSHGGWIASSVDLARFAVNAPGSWQHLGALSGTSSWLIDLGDGVSAALVLNSAAEGFPPSFYDAFKDALGKAAGEATWPGHDLFNQYP